MFLFPNILSNFCVPTLFKEYYEKHSGEAVGRGQTAPMRHPKVSQSFSLGGLTAVNVGKHSNFSFRLWTTSLSKKLVQKRNTYKIVHFKGYYPPISFQTCPYFLRSTSDPIRPWIIGLVSDLYRRRVGGGTELGYLCCGNMLYYRMLWMLLRAIFVRKSELLGFFM